MVTKNKAGQKKSKVKVGKLKLNKETVKDLTDAERKTIKGALPQQPGLKGSVKYFV